MIGGLQGEFGDLDIKYLKQNISKCWSQISRSFRRTPRHCILRENSPGKRYQRIRICLTGEVETSSSLIQMWDIRSEDPDMSDRGSWNVLLSHPDVRYPAPQGYPDQLHPDSPGWKELCRKGDRLRTRCRDPSPGWHGVRKAIRINSIQISQEDTRHAPLSRFP